MNDIVILAKVDKMYNILKSLLATGYWSRHEDASFMTVNAFSTCFVFVRVVKNQKYVIYRGNR